MKRFAWLLLLLASPAFGQGLELKGNTTTVKVARVVTLYDERTAVKEFPVTVEIPASAKSFRPSWSVPAGVTYTDQGRSIVITAAPKGDYTIKATWGIIDFEKREAREESGVTAFLVGDGTPTPEPKPEPAKPEPKPDPTPIPTAGFRVLIVTETSDLSKLPSSQVSVLTAKSIKDYLDLRCVEVAGRKEWRMWDKDVSTKNVSKVWQDAMALPRTSLPWIVISNGVAGYSGPLPATVNETLELLKKYGGV